MCLSFLLVSVYLLLISVLVILVLTLFEVVANMHRSKKQSLFISLVKPKSRFEGVSVMKRVVSVSGLPPTPVQLLYPVSRFSNVKSLQHLCRFCIRQLVRIDHIQELPLPKYDPLTPYIT